VSVTVEFAPSRVIVHASGDVTFTECVRAEEELIAHPEVGAGSRVIVDGRDVNTAPSTADLRTLARGMKPLAERGLEQMAIVAGNDFVYGVARMFGVFALAVGLRVVTFRDMRDAERWVEAA